MIRFNAGTALSVEHNASKIKKVVKSVVQAGEPFRSFGATHGNISLSGKNCMERKWCIDIVRCTIAVNLTPGIISILQKHKKNNQTSQIMFQKFFLKNMKDSPQNMKSTSLFLMEHHQIYLLSSSLIMSESSKVFLNS